MTGSAPAGAVANNLLIIDFYSLLHTDERVSWEAAEDDIREMNRAAEE